MMGKFETCVALLVSMGAVYVSGQACIPGSFKCLSCLQPGKCAAGGALAAEGSQCASGTVCVEYAGFAFCGTPQTSPCNNCGSDITACDPYDGKTINSCTGITPTVVKACPVKCEKGACVELTSGGVPLAPVCASAAANEMRVNKPTCTTGVLCGAGGAVINYNVCPAGQYFSLNINKCKSSPINHCEGITQDGLFPHLTDCSKGVVCMGGKNLLAIQCAAGEKFNLTKCVTDAASVVCPAMDGCTQI